LNLRSVRRENIVRGCLAGILALDPTAVFAQASTPAPMEECAPFTVPMVCLDAKLAAANKRLNAALKSAQVRLEKLQNERRRLVLGAFIDSQRKFNAYRDAQCTWQSIRGAPGSSGIEYVKDCQIRETIARENALLAFANSGDEEVVADTVSTPVESVNVESSPGGEVVVSTAETNISEAAAAGVGPEATSAVRANEWRLFGWISNGVERSLVPGTHVTIAFDPAGKVSGFASVNRYAGRFQFENEERLRWLQPGAVLTRMKGEPELMSQEKAFLESLRRTVVYRVEDRQLHLESSNGSTVLTFKR
jgi:heat shock protein HslJ/uncharacterized protein YecT (DUF1311 family)